MTPRQLETARLLAAVQQQGLRVQSQPKQDPTPEFNCNRNPGLHDQRRVKKQRYVVYVRPNGLPSRASLREQNRCVECGKPAQFYGADGYGLKCEPCNKEANEKRREWYRVEREGRTRTNRRE